MRLILLADGQVGSDIARWLFANFWEDVALLVTVEDNELVAAARRAQIKSIVFDFIQADL